MSASGTNPHWHLLSNFILSPVLHRDGREHELMVLIIFWNGLYRTKRKQQNLMERHIQAHFGRKRLWKWNVKFAVISLQAYGLGESSSANWGSHVTVDFHTQAHVHMSTHHVYHTKAAYGGQEETTGLSRNFRCDWGHMARVWQSALEVAEASLSVQQAPQTAKKLSIVQCVQLYKHTNPQAYKSPPLKREAKAQLAWISLLCCTPQLQHKPAFSNVRLRHSLRGSAVEPCGHNDDDGPADDNVNPDNDNNVNPNEDDDEDVGDDGEATNATMMPTPTTTTTLTIVTLKIVTPTKTTSTMITQAEFTTRLLPQSALI
ncbi:hypothetical protein EDB85DRAFT_1897796 [Lactarius pseudohatsudake]|nr:hypothetical protein EDB85DRAFT_1897796 [Lactarius pseudohatsudake]